jgi:hypothetical protein
MTCIRYADLEQCFKTPLSIIEADSATTNLPVFASRPGVQLLATHIWTLYIDIRSYTPVRPELPSVDILPYIRAHFTMPHVRFHFMTWNDTQGRLLADLANEVIHQHALSWRNYIIDSSNVEKVVVWWKAKGVDIVLRVDSSWAMDWDCGVQGGSVTELKTTLGLVAKETGEWTGDVVVASVECA